MKKTFRWLLPSLAVALIVTVSCFSLLAANAEYAKLDGANYFGEEKSSMLNRIDVEKLTPTMYLLELFASELNASEYLSMVDEFENKMIDLGITSIFRTESLAQTLKRWRSNFN